jgi:hypothetical protein
MAQRVWITEFAAVKVEAPAPFANLPALVHQPVLDVAAGAVTSAPFNAQTRYIRIVCETRCAIRVGATATPSALLLPAYLPEYFGVPPGQTISIVAAP